MNGLHRPRLDGTTDHRVRLYGGRRCTFVARDVTATVSAIGDALRHGWHYSENGYRENYSFHENVSLARFIAGEAGFLTLIQFGDRPLR
jgi:hypothetical protein